MNPTQNQNPTSNEPCRCGDYYCSDMMPKNQDRSDCCQYCGYYDCDVCGWVAPATGTAAQAATEPISQDRYQLTDQGREVLDAERAEDGEAPGSVPQVLRSAALYLETHGWIQGGYYDSTSGVFTPPACMVGAIGMVCYGGPVDAPALHFQDPGFADFEQAVLHLDRYLLVEDGTESYEFNDAKGRTIKQITGVLRQAAAVPEDELIDALKAIDDMNDRLAESGITKEHLLCLLLNSGATPTADGTEVRDDGDAR